MLWNFEKLPFLGSSFCTEKCVERKFRKVFLHVSGTFQNLQTEIRLYHGIRRMVEARSGLPKKSLTLTMKKRVLECKFGVTYF